MTKEECLKELAQPELPQERAAYLLGYLKALDPQHLPPRELWDRVLGGNDERMNRHFSWGATDALIEVIYPRLQEKGISMEQFGSAMRALNEGQDFLLWVHVQLNPELAEHYPKRMARIAARLGARAEA